MKIAYFSPLPPKRTGIATYSAHLSRALAEQAEIDFFETEVDAPPVPGARIIDYVDRPEELLALGDYDSVVYHIGNNPHYHLDLFKALESRPGVVVLHDTSLYFLFAGLGRGGMLREFLYNFGAGRLAEFFQIERDSPEGDVLRYAQPERYPFLRRVLDRATGIVVHSQTTAQAVRAAGYLGELRVIPHLAYPEMFDRVDPATRQAIRAELGVEEGELLIGCFGFIGPPKRLPNVLATLARLETRLPFKLLIVGEGEDPALQIAESGIAHRTIRPGFVDDARFRTLLQSSDLLINLRYPSMGEASGPLNQAMAAGIPSIVSDHAWFAELPDEAVCKIAVGEAEGPELERALIALWENADRRAALGEAGRLYSRRQCAPEIVASRYLDFLAEIGPTIPVARGDEAAEAAPEPTGAPSVAIAPSDPDPVAPASDDDWLRAYFDRRIQRAIPT